MVVSPEGGLNRNRPEFVRETTIGTTPSDPSFELYSDIVTDISFSMDSGAGVRRGINTQNLSTPINPWDVADFTPGGQNQEQHTVSVTYQLQRWLVDGSGNPQDAAGDAFLRNNDGQFNNTHTVMNRENRTVDGGADNAGLRIYNVAKGCYPSSCSVTGDPGTDESVMIDSLEYQAEKIREYKISQPSSSTLLVVKSSDSGDTSQTVTIENEGASTSEDVSLNGTNLVSTTTQFSDIDAIELSAETTGDVTVSINSGSQASPTEGTQLSIIYGTDTYNGGEGDLGVPALGNGSHASPDGGVFEEFINDNIERPDGTTLEEVVTSMSFNVENNLDVVAQHSTQRSQIDPGVRDITVDATVFGEDASWNSVKEMLQVTENDLRWEMTGGDLIANNAAILGGIDVSRNVGQVRISIGETFTAKGGVTIN